MWELQLWREIEFKIESVIEFVHYGAVEMRWETHMPMQVRKGTCVPRVLILFDHLRCKMSLFTFTLHLHFQVMPGRNIISLKQAHKQFCSSSSRTAQSNPMSDLNWFLKCYP